MSASANPSVMEYTDYRSFLVDEYQRRLKAEPAYSLRSFSKDLGLRPSALSDVLAGRYGLSSAMAWKMAPHLEFEENEAQYFVSLIELRHGRSSAIREAAETRLRRIRGGAWRFKKLSAEKIDLFAKWYQPVILELVTVDPKRDASAIAKILGVPEAEVAQSIALLEELELLAHDGERFHRLDPYVSGDFSTPQESIRSFHKQILNMATRAIDEVPAPKRKSVTTVFSFKNAQLSEARNEIDAFNDRFIESYETSQDPDAVYALTVQLFRVDRPNE